MQSTGLQMWDGGLWDQPWIFMMELLQAQNAEARYKRELNEAVERIREEMAK